MSKTRTQLLAATLERAMNKALQYDPGTRQSLQALHNKHLAIRCTEPEGILVFKVRDGHIVVATLLEGKADCQLTGSLSSLMTLAQKDTASLADTDVYIEGNPGVLSLWLELVKNLDVDWELALSERIGSVPAHALATAIRSQAQWLRARAQKLPGYLSEVLTEELRVVPSRNEAEHLAGDINQIRAHTSRLEARIAQLKQKLYTRPQPKS